jgi:hypothetical protein
MTHDKVIQTRPELLFQTFWVQCHRIHNLSFHRAQECWVIVFYTLCNTSPNTDDHAEQWSFVVSSYGFNVLVSSDEYFWLCIFPNAEYINDYHSCNLFLAIVNNRYLLLLSLGAWSFRINTDSFAFLARRHTTLARGLIIIICSPSSLNSKQ